MQNSEYRDCPVCGSKAEEIKLIDIPGLLIFFKDCLPKSYKNGFVSDINNCCKGLNLIEKLIIKI